MAFYCLMWFHTDYAPTVFHQRWMRPLIICYTDHPLSWPPTLLTTLFVDHLLCSPAFVYWPFPPWWLLLVLCTNHHVDHPLCVDHWFKHSLVFYFLNTPKIDWAMNNLLLSWLIFVLADLNNWHIMRQLIILALVCLPDMPPWKPSNE